MDTPDRESIRIPRRGLIWREWGPINIRLADMRHAHAGLAWHMLRTETSCAERKNQGNRNLDLQRHPNQRETQVCGFPSTNTDSQKILAKPCPTIYYCSLIGTPTPLTIWKMNYPSMHHNTPTHVLRETWKCYCKGPPTIEDSPTGIRRKRNKKRIPRWYN